MNKATTYISFGFIFTFLGIGNPLFGQPDYLKINKVPPLSPSFNSDKYQELNPIISPNGQMILFTRVGHPDNFGGIADPGDIWCKKRLFNGSWGEPYHLGRSINNAQYNYAAGIDINSKIIYLNNTYHAHDTSRASIYYTKYTNGIFTAPHKVEVKGLENFPAPILMSAASTNNYLIISLAKSINDRRENLFISYKVDGDWTTPIPMNDEINSSEREIFPYMPNDTTLYFCSNGLAGYGGMDGYITQRITADWNSSTLPYNLGPKFNSENEETNVSISQDFELYYLQELRNNAKTYIRTIKGIPLEFDILGTTLDQKGKSLAGTVEIHDLDYYENNYHLHSNNLGRFSTKIHQRTGLKLTAHMPGYLPQIILTSPSQLKEEEPLTVDFTLQKIILGQNIPLNEIHFSDDGRDLVQTSALTLEMIAEALEQNPELSAILTLDTYRSNDIQENKRIAEMEAKSIRSALDGKGAPMKHILIIPNFQNIQNTELFNTKVQIVFIKK